MDNRTKKSIVIASAKAMGVPRVKMGAKRRNMSYTIVGQNSNYVEEIPAFDADVTRQEVKQYIHEADKVKSRGKKIILYFEFDDGTKDEIYIITPNK